MLTWAETCSCGCCCVRRLSASIFDSLSPSVHEVCKTTLKSTQCLGLQSAALHLSLDASWLPSVSNGNLRRILQRLQDAHRQKSATFKDARRPVICPRLSELPAFTILSQAMRATTESVNKIRQVQMLATLDRERPRTQNTRGLNMGKVRIGTVQMAAAVITATAEWDRTQNTVCLYFVDRASRCSSC